MSASAPAGSASSITGKVSAVSTSATIDGSGESEVISHPAPTSCIHVPTLETMEAIHSLRNSVFRSGAQGDPFLVTSRAPGSSPGPRGEGFGEEVEHRAHARQAMALLRIDREHREILVAVELRQHLHEPSVADRIGHDETIHAPHAHAG